VRRPERLHDRALEVDAPEGVPATRHARYHAECVHSLAAHTGRSAVGCEARTNEAVALDRLENAGQARTPPFHLLRTLNEEEDVLSRPQVQYAPCISVVPEQRETVLGRELGRGLE